MDNLIEQIDNLIKDSKLSKLNYKTVPFNISNTELKEIIDKSIKSESDNILASGFKDGEAYTEFDLSEYFKNSTSATLKDDLSNLPCSMRITNIQMQNEELKRFCLNLFKKFDIPVTANLYITPGAGLDCFKTHADIQESLIYQLEGRKKWIIPTLNGKDVFDISAKDSKDYEQFESRSLEIKKDELYYLPHCIVHKAEAFESELSIHITFAILSSFKSMISLFIQDEISKVLEDLETPHLKIDKGSSQDYIEKIIRELFNKDSKTLNNQFWARINQESLKILKKGRPYDKNISEMD